MKQLPFDRKGTTLFSFALYPDNSKIKNDILNHYNCSMDYISFIWFLADSREVFIDKRAFFTLHSPINFVIGPLINK